LRSNEFAAYPSSRLICKAALVTHYVVTIEGAPAGEQHRLLVTNDDGHHRTVSVRLSDQTADGLGESDAVWRAAIYYAVRELEFAVRGDAWGVPVEDGPTIEIPVSGDELARFIGGRSANVPLNDGAVVGEFGA
jgi:hypothetical protein